MLTLCANSKYVPMGLVPCREVAAALGVFPEQVSHWIKAGNLRAEKHGGTWWVRIDTLTDFISRSKWMLVEPAPAPVIQAP